MSEDETVKVEPAVWRWRNSSHGIVGGWFYAVENPSFAPYDLDRVEGPEPFYSADAISSLQDELKRVNALLTASVDDYNTALEEVKRLREALTVTEALDHWLDTDPLIDVLGKLGRMSKTDFEKFRERGRAALTQ